MKYIGKFRDSIPQNLDFIYPAIGITRTKAKIGMMNLTYNIYRCNPLKIVVAPVMS